MTPIMLAILSAAGVAFAAFYFFIRNSFFAIAAAVTFLIVVLGLVGGGVEEETGRQVITERNETITSINDSGVNASAINGTTTTQELILRDQSRGVSDTALIVLYSCLALFFMYLGVFVEDD